MVYSESADFEDKIRSITVMDDRLKNSNIFLNWGVCTVLDIGGAGGLHSGLLAERVKRIYCADVVDSQVQYNGEFLRLLKEKFARNGFEFPLNRIEFNATSAMDLIYRDNFFDFVCSFNAFEHIPNPEIALSEIARVLKPSGYIYLNFDPIWTADTGSHFSHRVSDPWAHLTLKDEYFISQMMENGSSDWEVQEYRYAMNRVRLLCYKNIFFNYSNQIGLKLVNFLTWKGLEQDSHLCHRNYQIALNMGYDHEELLTRGIEVTFKKLESESE
jgi:ubiquinone/menaquinone biosynthesis C-methylase UbiE